MSKKKIIKNIIGALIFIVMGVYALSQDVRKTVCYNLHICYKTCDEYTGMQDAPLRPIGHEFTCEEIERSHAIQGIF